jgi:hypothetical protein
MMVSVVSALLIEDMRHGAVGGVPVRDAEGAAERGVGEPKCAAFWGYHASLTGASSRLVSLAKRDEPLSPEGLVDRDTTADSREFGRQLDPRSDQEQAGALLDSLTGASAAVVRVIV